MADQSAPNNSFEVYCMLCSRPLSEDDDIHFSVGPFGYDLDVMCGQCAGKGQQSSGAAGEEPSGAAAMGFGGPLGGAMGLGSLGGMGGLGGLGGFGAMGGLGGWGGFDELGGLGGLSGFDNLGDLGDLGGSTDAGDLSLHPEEEPATSEDA